MSPATVDEDRVLRLRKVEDFSTWAFQVGVVLKSKDLYGFLDGTEVMPVKLVAETDAVFAVRLAAWRTKDYGAQKAIAMTVDTKIIELIKNCETARDMWVKIGGYFEQQSETNVHLLQEKFYRLEMTESEDVVMFASRVEDLGKKLDRLGHEISESMLVTKILMSIRSKFPHFATAWDSTSNDQKTMANLINRLSTEEVRHKNVEKEVALVTKAKSSVSVSGKSQKLCFWCKKPGHVKAKCFSYKQYLKYNKGDDKNDGQSAKNKFFEKKDNKDSSSALVLQTDDIRDYDSWYLDSGASKHMSSRKEWFNNYREFDEPVRVRLGDDSVVFGLGKGTIYIHAHTLKNVKRCHLEEVLYVPNLKMNLLSLSSTLDKGYNISSNNDQIFINKGSETFVVGKKCNRLYKLLITVEKGDIASVARELNFDVWHQRIGHQNQNYVKKFLKHFEIENCIKSDTKTICEHCVMGKQSRKPFKLSSTETNEIGDIIHSDVCGPMEVESLGGNRYYVLFEDDYSNYRTIYTIKRKSEVSDKLLEFVNKLKRETGKDIKILRTDNGSEYINGKVEQIVKKFGMKHERTVVYTPEQNGVSERSNRTIVEMARTMLISKNLKKELWAEVVNSAVYLLNRTHVVDRLIKTPFEIWSGKQFDIDSLKVCGTRVFCHIPKVNRFKFDSKSKVGILIGYSEETKGYRIYFSETDKVEVHRDVVFGSEMGQDCVKVESLTDDFVSLDMTHTECEENNIIDDENEEFVSLENTIEEFGDNDVSEDLEQDVESEINENSEDEMDNANRYSLRKRKTIDYDERLSDSYSAMVACLDVVDFNEAMESNDKEKWKEAMKDECNSLSKNETWTLVKLPENRTCLDSKWVLRVKENVNDMSKRYKARLVVRGCRQKKDVDYFETYSPVARLETIRTLIAHSVSKNMFTMQFDVKTAFLYGKIDTEIYMRQPVGFNDGSDRVCKLNRSLYGLKQAPKCWNNEFTSFIKSLGFQVSDYDQCLFIKDRGKTRTLMVIYVDDGIVTSNDKNEINEFMLEMKSKFEITVSDLNSFLGVRIMKNDNQVILEQEHYTKKILQRFRMNESKSVATPMEVSKDGVIQEVNNNKSSFPYREAIGALLYLARLTRPDITFAVNYCSRFVENPTEYHVQLVKRILRYLRGSVNVGLVYRCIKDSILTGYSDSDFAGDLRDRKSTSGCVIELDGNVVAWFTRKQTTVALSSTEAEYISACEMVKELLWFRCLVQEMTGEKLKTLARLDNQSSIRMIEGCEMSRRSKHIDVKFHYIKHQYERGLFEIEYVPSDQQKADVMTKPLSKIKLSGALQLLSLGKGVGK